ncbi:uncharacterized protein TNCV_3649011 [Trichonephila clavipes]|nr:uncharacterized protein TNCV_3649011 [Trichonephila clavipes]
MSVSSQPVYFAHGNVFLHDGKPVPIELSNVTIPRDGSDSEVVCITVNHAGLTSKPEDFRSNCQENARLRLIHHPLPKSVPVEYLLFCVRGKFSQLAQGNRFLMVVKGTEQQKFYLELGPFAISLETPHKFKDICNGTFLTPCMRVCTRKRTFHAAPWRELSRQNILTQQHISSAFFAHANVFHHGRQPVPIELSIASIPEDGKDPEVICITVDHSNFITTSKDSRANSRYPILGSCGAISLRLYRDLEQNPGSIRILKSRLDFHFYLAKPKPLLSRLPGPARLYPTNSHQLTLFLDFYNTLVRRFEEYLLNHKYCIKVGNGTDQIKPEFKCIDSFI